MDRVLQHIQRRAPNRWGRVLDAGTRGIFAQLAGAIALPRFHRELPQDWVERHEADFVEREMSAIEANLAGLADKGMAQVLRRRRHSLRQQAQRWRQPVKYSWDYLLAINAERLAKVDPPPRSDGYG